MRNLWTLALLSLLTTGAFGQSGNLPGHDGRSAGVLCAWSYYALARAVGDRCFPHEQTGFKSNVIPEMLSKFELFIAENTSPGELETLQAQLLRTVGKYPRGLCGTPGLIELFRALERAPIASMRSEVNQLLSVPHKPVLGLCL